MELTLSGSNIIAIDDLRGDQFMQKARNLTNGIFTEYLIKRTINADKYEGVLLSKSQYDALIAAAALAPAEDKHVVSDDFVIQNLMDVFDILNGRQQAGYNSQVAHEGTRYVDATFAGTIPATPPYTINTDAELADPVTAASPAGSAMTVVSYASSVVTFGAGDAGLPTVITFAEKMFAVYEIHATLGTPTDPYCYLLSYDEYSAL